MKHFKLLVSILLPLLLLLLPTESIPIEGLTLVEHRVLALFLLATLFWVLEPIPIFATSILILMLQLLMISDNALGFLRAAPQETLGTLISYKSIMATLASPIILLFLGGFSLAMAATKYNLDINLARVLLRPFGQKPRFLLLGLMAITALFSMFMSNTATTAMMLAILAPVLGIINRDDPARVAFLLGIPFAANIGGIGTPIGTPPNAVAMKYLVGDYAVSFSQWMAFALPFVLVMLAIVWFLLLAFFKPRAEKLELVIKNRFMRSPKAITVYITFAATILMWIFTDFHGINSYIVAMAPLTIFLVSGVIGAEDIKKFNWDVLWLIAGGIALGMAMEKSGLSQHLIASIPFASFSPYIIILTATLLALLMATFMSNTATANLLLPLMAALGSNLETLSVLGGGKMLIIAVTISCSIAMGLPVSTPPNAMAYANGGIKTPDMMRAGATIGIIALIFVYLLMWVLRSVHFL